MISPRKRTSRPEPAAGRIGARRLLPLALVLAAAVLPLGGCGDDDPVDPAVERTWSYALEPEYTQLLVRALLLDDRIPEARSAMDDWVQRTGDTSARQELEAMIDQVERARAERDSANAPEGEGQ